MNTPNFFLGLYEKAMPDFESWEDKLLLAANSRFDWLELSIDESEKKLARLSDNTFAPKLSRAISNTGVPVRTMCLSGHRKYSLGSKDKAVRQTGLDIMEKALELSCDVGIRLIQLAGYDVYYESSDEYTRLTFQDNLYKAVELASTYGVCLGFETMETSFLDTVEKGMRFVDAINSPYLGMYPDIGNLKNASVIYGTKVVDDIHTGAGHIFAAHLKETKPGIYRDLMFGTGGHTEYVPCIKELLKQGVHMFTGEFWYHGEEKYADILSQASAFLRNRIIQAQSELSA